MYRPKFLKVLAIFLAINILQGTILPTAIMALTAGPTAPEYTSFEPIDTTDMVNLLTGDFNYNIPLLEVPGPEGGYPLSLSYHAGIKPGVEASWVGLGWSLNPGAINRTVNGYADDIHSTTNTRRDYWKGGSTHTYGIGLTIGPFGMTGPSFGLQVAHDTYQGFGVGASVGFSAGKKFADGKVGITAEMGSRPYGGPYASVNASAGIAVGSAMSLGGNIGLSTNFESVGGYGGVGLNISKASLGASISSQGLKGSARVAGFSANQSNDKAGKITTQSSGFNLSIPTPKFSIDLSYNRTRYWSDERSNVTVSGTLYSDVAGSKSPSTHSMDSYTLLDESLPGGIVDNDDPKKTSGGSFLAHDNYSVSAQGLGGSISPYVFKGKNLFTQNKKNKNIRLVSYYPVEDRHDGKTEFKFDNDFSNSMVRGASQFITNSDTRNGSAPSYQTTNPAHNTPDEGLNNNHLAGSKHIEWFTNEDIGSGNARDLGFVDYQLNSPGRTTVMDFVMYDYNDKEIDNPTVDERLKEKTDVRKNIGGFMITNESGVNYHYALPVYTYGAYQRSQKITDPGGQYTKIENRDAYAYTWLLTTMTGPDYVDRNNNGIADEGDWGYWVKMDYGKWTDKYVWRTPAKGTKTDLNNEYENLSYGYKELYYLDKVQTRTHTALFVKEIRKDGKGSSDLFRNYSALWLSSVARTITSDSKDRNGEFKSKNGVYDFRHSWYDNDADGHRDYKSFPYRVSPVSTLQLKEIYLVNNNDLSTLDDIRGKSNIYHQDKSIDAYFHEPTNTNIDGVLNQHYHQGRNVIDIHDIAIIQTQLDAMALRKIKFNTDYSLCKGTPNSFVSELDVMNTSQASSENVLDGKLTLNSIEFLAKGGASTTPPMSFEYDLEESNKVQTVVHGVTSNADIQAGKIPKCVIGFNGEDIHEEGDIFYYRYSDKDYYFVLLDKINPNSFYAQTIGGNNLPYSTLHNVMCNKTKNPPYVADATDIWGYFKSDYDASIENENLRRMVTDASSKQVDAWSLRKVNTSLGASVEVEYESDEYSTAKLYYGVSLPVKAMTNAYGSDEISINLFNESNNVLQYIRVGDLLDISASFIRQEYYNDGDIVTDKLWAMPIKEYTTEVTNINNGIITVKSTDLRYDFNFSEKRGQYHWHDINLLHAANVQLGSSKIFGGGLRVKSISTKNFDIKSSSKYHFSKKNLISSGITAYEPYAMNTYQTLSISVIDPPDYDHTIRARDHSEENFKKHLYESFSHLLANTRELPAPGVMYEYVTMTEEVTRNGKTAKVPTSTQYHFEVFNEDMVELDRTPYQTKVIAITDHYDAVEDCPPCDPMTDPGCEDDDCVEPARTEYYDVNIKQKQTEIKDYTARVGRLLDVTSFDRDGRILTQTVNHYLDDTIKLKNEFNNQGVMTQSFTELKRIDNAYREFIGAISRKTVYPNVMLGTTQHDFRNNTMVTTQNLEFDFYTGSPTKVLTNDAYGNSYVNEVIPAYKIDKYKNGENGRPGMGLKVHNKQNKNMLTQQAANYIYKVNPEDPSEIQDVISASVTTWADQWGYRENNNGAYSYSEKANDAHPTWRSHKNYVYQSNFTKENGAITDFTNFNWATNTQADEWKKVSELTLYDRNSHALEMTDLNGKYAATKMDGEGKRVMATVANAKYEEFTYSGFEQADDGEIVSEGTVTDKKSHTGSNSVALNAGKTLHYQLPAQSSDNSKYILSYWTLGTDAPQVKAFYFYESQVAVEESGFDENKKVTLPNGDIWYWNRAVITIPSGSTNIEIGVRNQGNSTVNIDDLRIHPFNAAMTSYVYDQQTGELTHILDANNFFTKFEYDASGKLSRTYRESLSYGVKLLNDQHYNYKLKAGQGND
jgi:YD repeat-containing protein